jgi:hypothetical protein
MKVRCVAGPFNGLIADIPKAEDSSVPYKLKLRDQEEWYALGQNVIQGGWLLAYAPERESEESFIPGEIV